MKKQKLILLLVIITAIATALFLPGLVRADVIVDNPDATFVWWWNTLSGHADGYGADLRYLAGGAAEQPVGLTYESTRDHLTSSASSDSLVKK